MGVPVVVLGWLPHEHVIRFAGLLLQLAGIGTVWWGIRETRKLFEHPTFLMQMRQWFRRRPRYGGRVITATTAAASGSATFAGRGSVWMAAGRDATLEQKIEIVEKNLERVRDDLGRFQNKIDDDIRRQDVAIKHEQHARERADRDTRERLNLAQTGGLHISAVGALWLLAGVTMGTIPAELAHWFG